MTLAELKAAVQLIIQDSSFDDYIVSYLNQAQLEIAGGMQSSLGSWITPPLPDLLTIGTVTTDSTTAAYTTYSEIKTLISTGDTLSFAYNDVLISVTCTGDSADLQTDINSALVVAEQTSDSVVVSWDINNLILTCAGNVNSDTIIGDIYTNVDTSNTIIPVDTVLISAVGYVSLPDNYQRQVQFVVNSSGVEVDLADSFISFVETYPAINQTGSISEVIDQGNLIYYQGIPSEAEELKIHYYRTPVDMSDDTDEPDGVPSHLQKGLLVNHTCWKLYELIEDGIEGPGPNTQRYMENFFTYLRLLELSIPYPRKMLEIM